MSTKAPQPVPSGQHPMAPPPPPPPLPYETAVAYHRRTGVMPLSANFRGRSREELVAECASILDCGSWDQNSVANSAERLADLLIDLTGKTGLHRQ